MSFVFYKPYKLIHEICGRLIRELNKHPAPNPLFSTLSNGELLAILKAVYRYFHIAAVMCHGSTLSDCAASEYRGYKSDRDSERGSNNDHRPDDKLSLQGTVARGRFMHPIHVRLGRGALVDVVDVCYTTTFYAKTPTLYIQPLRQNWCGKRLIRDTYEFRPMTIFCSTDNYGRLRFNDAYTSSAGALTARLSLIVDTNTETNIQNTFVKMNLFEKSLAVEAHSSS